MRLSRLLTFIVYTAIDVNLLRKKRSTNNDTDLNKLHAFVMKDSSFATFCKGGVGRKETEM